jgi:hypothetical protein
MILPFKRKIASLIIRTDIWRDDLARKSKQVGSHEQTRSRALAAVAELDGQVALLADLKLPGEKKALEAEAEVKNLLQTFGSMRQMLMGMANGNAAAA